MVLIKVSPNTNLLASISCTGICPKSPKNNYDENSYTILLFSLPMNQESRTSSHAMMLPLFFSRDRCANNTNSHCVCIVVTYMHNHIYTQIAYMRIQWKFGALHSERIDFCSTHAQKTPKGTLFWGSCSSPSSSHIFCEIRVQN